MMHVLHNLLYFLFIYYTNLILIWSFHINPTEYVMVRLIKLSFFAVGYKNQLSYQRADGSFSAFGRNDTSGSIWYVTSPAHSYTASLSHRSNFSASMLFCLVLCHTRLTAFVLRCFLQAQSYMQINESVLTSAMGWLLKHQGPNGEFVEVGRVIHSEMQRGLDDDSVALTAYVLLAFLEEETYSVSPWNLCFSIKMAEYFAK